MELKGLRWPELGSSTPGEDAPAWPAAGEDNFGSPAQTGPLSAGTAGEHPGNGASPTARGAGPAGTEYWWPEASQQGGARWGTTGYPGVPAAQPRSRTRQAGKGPESKLRRAWRRFIATLAAIGAFLAKFGALLLKLKYVGLVLSMLVSVLAYTLFFGWTFAIGFVLLIFVHEMGHVIVLRRQGVPASAPLFIPFLGAFVNMRQMPRNAYQEAVSGLAGPYFGTAASAAVAVWGHATGSNFLLQLGAVGFLINLFNLLPVLPLDGGRAAAALHPVLWLVGLLGLLAWEFFAPSPVALLVLVLGGFELYRRWTRRNSPASVAYHSLAANQRMAVAAMYILVVAVAVAGYQLTYVARGL